MSLLMEKILHFLRRLIMFPEKGGIIFSLVALNIIVIGLIYVIVKKIIK